MPSSGGRIVVASNHIGLTVARNNFGAAYRPFETEWMGAYGQFVRDVFRKSSVSLYYYVLNGFEQLDQYDRLERSQAPQQLLALNLLSIYSVHRRRHLLLYRVHRYLPTLPPLQHRVVQ